MSLKQRKSIKKYLEDQQVNLNKQLGQKNFQTAMAGNVELIANRWPVMTYLIKGFQMYSVSVY